MGGVSLFSDMIDATVSPVVIVAGEQASFGHQSQKFEKIDEQYFPWSENGTSLVEANVDTFVYTLRDGTVLTVDKRIITPYGSSGTVTKAVYPSGFEVNIHYKTVVLDGRNYHRIQSVTSNNGLQFKYQYIDNTLASSTSLSQSRWGWPTQITAINNTTEYCNPVSDSCTLSGIWPSVTYNWFNYADLFERETLFSVTDSGGRITQYRQNIYPVDINGNSEFHEPRIVGIKRATSSGAETETYDYAHLFQCRATSNSGGVGSTCAILRSNAIYKSAMGAAEWTYTYESAPYNYIPTWNHSDGPDGRTSVNINNIRNAPFQMRTADGTLTRLTDDRKSWVSSVTYPEGNVVNFAYDQRNNLIERREKAKPGSSLADIVTTAGFDTVCINIKTCNQPDWVVDAKGNRTYYTYHMQSGNIATVTGPADDNGIRPQTRYTYQQKYAWVKNAAGNYVKEQTPIWLLTKESTCIKGTALGNGCALANDEVITTYDYGPDSGPNNLFLRGVVRIADGQMLRTCYVYDDYGNRIGETTPQAGLTSCL